MHVAELLQAYLSENPDVRSANTERLMRIVVKHFADFIGGEADASQLTDKNLVGFMRWRRKNGIAEITLENEAAKLRALAVFAHHLELVPHVRFSVKHQRPPVPQAMSEQQVNAMFEAARGLDGLVGGVPCSIYFVAMFAVGWDTAARANSIHQLRRGDIDFDRKQVTFRVMKGNAPAMTKPIRESTIEALRQLLEHSPGERPFASVKSASIYYHLKRIKLAAGIPLNKRNGMHDFRRAHATAVWAAGGDATEALGHASDAVTRKWYIDPRKGRKQPLQLLADPSGWRAKLSQFWRKITFRKTSASHT